MSPACERTHAFLDGRLGEGEATEVNEHLRSCAHCRSLVKTWERFASGYLGAEEPLSPPSSGETQRMMARLNARVRAPAWRGPALIAVPSAVALAIVTLAAAYSALSTRRTPTVVAVEREIGDAGVVFGVDGVLETGPSAGILVHLGSDRVGLSARSRVRLLHRDGASVRISLERGTLAAAVQHRLPGQSFTIEVDGVRVTVVGTRFRVLRHDRGLRVEVAEGHVRVACAWAEYDVMGGHALDVTSSTGNRMELTNSVFPELDESAAMTWDGGSTEALPVEPPSTPPVAAAKLQRWSRAASSGRCQEVLPEIRSTLREAPEHPKVYRALADCLRLLGRSREAVGAYTQVIALSAPDDADAARLLLANVLHNDLKEEAQTERLLRAYLSRAKPPELEAGARVLLARALIAQHRSRDAREELTRVTHRLPSSAEALEALELLRTLEGQ